MKYFGRMITRLLIDNQFIEEEEKQDMQKEFDASFDKQNKSTNKIVKAMNGIFSHPFGVLVSILLFVFVRKQVSRSNQVGEENEFQHEFKLQMQKKIMDDMIDN